MGKNVNNYLENLQKRKLPNNLRLNVKKNNNRALGRGIGRNGYMLKIYNKNGIQAARLYFRLTNSLIIASGETIPQYEGRHIGTFLRAIATKAGSINKKSKGVHFGTFTSNKATQRGVPNSTRILGRLGWKVTNAGKSGHKSEFNYKTTNMKAVNNAINNFLKSKN